MCWRHGRCGLYGQCLGPTLKTVAAFFGRSILIAQKFNKRHGARKCWRNRVESEPRLMAIDGEIVSGTIHATVSAVTGVIAAVSFFNRQRSILEYRVLAYRTRLGPITPSQISR